MSYSPEWTAAPVILAALLLFLIVPPFALIALVVVALAVLAALVALAGAVLASPYLLVRTIHRHLAERRRSTERPGPMARTVAALTHPTTARSSQ
jgi:hypothetical protein